MKKMFGVLQIAAIILMISGCSFFKMEDEIVGVLEYTIVEKLDVPNEITELIEKNKEKKMNFTYSDQDKTFLIIGYGEQRTSGYSIEVKEVYEGENVIVVKTNLRGPSSNEEVHETATYPYIVLLVDGPSKPVVFE